MNKVRLERLSAALYEPRAASGRWITPEEHEAVLKSVVAAIKQFERNQRHGRIHRT